MPSWPKLFPSFFNARRRNKTRYNISLLKFSNNFKLHNYCLTIKMWNLTSRIKALILQFLFYPFKLTSYTAVLYMPINYDFSCRPLNTPQTSQTLHLHPTAFCILSLPIRILLSFQIPSSVLMYIKLSMMSPAV